MRVFQNLVMIIIFTLTASLFYTACSGRGNNATPDNPRDRDDNDDGGGSNNNNNNNNRNSCDGGDRDGGGDCTDDSARNEDSCQDKCDKIFGGRTDRNKCYKLTQDAVEGMFKAFNEEDGYLLEGEVDDLDLVSCTDISNMLNIDEGDQWFDLIRKSGFGSSEAKDTLLWLAENPAIYKVVDKELDDDDIESLLTQLLRKIGSGGSITAGLLRDIGGDSNKEETFIYLALNADNKDAAKEAIKLLNDENYCFKDVPRTSNFSCETPPSTGTTCGEGNTIYDKTSGRFLMEATHRFAACALGEVFCAVEEGVNRVHQDADVTYLFDGVFVDLLDVADDLEDYIENSAPNIVQNGSQAIRGGLNLSSDDAEDIEEVCEAFCQRFVPSNKTNVNRDKYPKYCRKKWTK